MNEETTTCTRCNQGVVIEVSTMWGELRRFRCTHCGATDYKKAQDVTVAEKAQAVSPANASVWRRELHRLLDGHLDAPLLMGTPMGPAMVIALENLAGLLRSGKISIPGCPVDDVEAWSE